MQKCGKCQTEITPEAKFCAGCGVAKAEALGEATVLADEDFDEALSALDTLAKANGALSSDIVADDPRAERRAAVAAAAAADDDDDDPAAGDEDPDDDGDDEPTRMAAPVAKGRRVDKGGGLNVVDAGPLVQALLDANNRQARSLKALGRDVRAMRRDQGVLAKANAALLKQNRTLREELAVIGADVEQVATKGAGRRSTLAGDQPLRKGVSVDPARGTDPNVLRGADLVAKATHIGLQHPELLSALNVSAINEYALQGLDQNQINQVDPELGQRLSQAFAASTH